MTSASRTTGATIKNGDKIMARSVSVVPVVTESEWGSPPASTTLSKTQQIAAPFVESAIEEFWRDYTEHDGKLVDKNSLRIELETDEQAKVFAPALRNAAVKLGQDDDRVEDLFTETIVNNRGYKVRCRIRESEAAVIWFRVTGAVGPYRPREDTDSGDEDDDS